MKLISRNSILVLFLSIVLPSLTLASMRYVHLAECDYEGDSVRISIAAHEWGGPFPAMGVAVKSSESATVGILAGFYPVKIYKAGETSYSFDFVGYSGIPDFSSANCKLGTEDKPRERERIVSLKVKSHFVYESYNWDDPRSLEELERDCVAIPLEINILCGQSQNSSGPFFCNWVEISEGMIPIDSGHCTGF